MRRVRKLKRACSLCYARPGQPCWDLRVYRKTGQLRPTTFLHRLTIGSVAT